MGNKPRAQGAQEGGKVEGGEDTGRKRDEKRWLNKEKWKKET